MLHMRRERARALTDFASPITLLWDRLIASDPGLLRLIMACRGTLSVFLTAFVAIGLARLLGAAPIEFASGVTLSLMAPFLMREPTRQQRQRTLLALAVPAAASTVATTLLHGHGPLGDCFFLVLVFLCFLLQACSPAAIGQGLMAVVTSYVGLYLELPPASLPLQLLSVVMAIPVTGFACFVVLPLRPAVTLRRTVRAVQARAAAVLHHAGLMQPGAPATERRLSRSLARLNEAALAADDQLAFLDPVGNTALRQHLMDLELAAGRLAAAPMDFGARRALRHAARLQVAAHRLRHGRWSARDRRAADRAMGAPSTAGALTDITRAAAALDGASIQQAAPPPRQPAPPGPLAWRIALRVTLASALAMAGGMAVSPNRWFWAVITVYVVFLNTRSRGDTIYKGVERLGGTLLGLVAGVSIAAVLQGNAPAEVAVLFAAIFGMYYLFLVSYTLGIICVTVLLGVLYSLLGAPMEPLLVLRLEETGIGAAAAILVAATVLPLRTRDQVASSGAAVLRALAAATGNCRAVLTGQAAEPPLVLLRAMDKQLADLRLALLPLTIGRLALRRSAAERPVQALLDCVYWVRMLAAEVATPMPDAACRAMAIERRLAALAAGSRAVPDLLPPGDRHHPVMAMLHQLDQATIALAERLAIGQLQGFHLER